MARGFITGYRPFEKQELFHTCASKFRLFGGARGPGKSRSLLEEAISICTVEENDGKFCVRKNGSGIHAIILRTSVIDLEDSVISKWRQMDWNVFRIGNKQVKFNEQKKIITFPNGATLRFGYASNEADLAQYLGADYAFIGIDELTLFPTYKMWINLLGCLRCTVPGIKPRMAATANPGNRGHEWVKSLFVVGKPAEGMEEHQYRKEDYEYIPADYMDGPFRDDQDYINNLMAQPAVIRMAWITGDWDIRAGAYFDHWNAAMSVPLDDITLESWCPRWVSIDWGFKHNCSIHWHYLAPKDGSGKNVVYTYREKVVVNKGSREVGDIIVELSKGEKIDAVYLSPDGFAKRDSSALPTNVQIAERFKGTGIPAPQRATDDRAAGWTLMYEMLRDGEWKICDSCPEALNAIPSVSVNPSKIDDVLKTATVADDVADDLRYGIQSQMKNRVRSKPRGMVEKEILAAIQDRYLRQLKSYEMLLKHKQDGQPIKDRIVPRWRAGR